MSFSLQTGDPNEKFDDDGRQKRTGTLMTATAHIVTAVIGSGVLSLAWAIAQLGWVAGPIAIFVFSIITCYTSMLLADCYRSPDPIFGERNYNYMDVVKANLGGIKVQLCGIAQYGILVGVSIGYTITTSISMVAIKRSNCFHKNGHQVGCHTSNNLCMIIFGLIQIILSQLPNLHKLYGLSVVAAAMSFIYSSVGIALSIAKIAGGAHPRTSLTGIPVGNGFSNMDKMWNIFSALGNIALSYTFANVIVEIQDTLKSYPAENKVMKKASFIAISISTIFYMTCGVVGYAAFGNDAPGNFLTGFGFYDPYWLVDLANFCIVVHLVGAYQVFSQPLFAFVERWCSKKWPNHKFITAVDSVYIPFYGIFTFSFFRMIWRTAYVTFTTVLAMIFPFFNDFLGLLGASAFWPLTVYFPIEMYIAQAKIKRFSLTWIWMQILVGVCFIISLLSAAGSIRGIAKSLQIFKPFKSVS